VPILTLFILEKKGAAITNSGMGKYKQDELEASIKQFDDVFVSQHQLVYYSASYLRIL